ELKLVEMAQRDVKMAKLGRELALIQQRAREMQLVTFSDLVPIDQDAALRGTGAASAPGIVECPEIRDGGAPAIAAARTIGGGTERRQHRQRMKDGNVTQATRPL